MALAPGANAVRVPIVGDDREFQRAVDRSQTRLAAFKQSADAAIGRLTRLSAAGAAAGLVLGGTLGRAVIRTAAEFQSLEASLRTVTGGAAAAQDAFDRIKDFAASTPFDLQQVTAAFIKLKALGLDPSEEALRSYGNTASAMGKSLNDAVEAVADAATGEFERLKEFGIRASSEGDRVTFTFQGVSTTVRKNAEEIEAYLRRIGEVQFAGAMEEQARTLGGALSNLGDATTVFLNAVGEGGFAGAVADIARELASAAQGADGLARSLGAGMADATETAVRGLGHVMDVTGGLIERIEQNPLLGPFGLLGFLIFGKKGLVAGGLAAEVVERVARAVGLMEETASQEYRRLQENIARLEAQRVPGDENFATGKVLQARIDQMKRRQQEILAGANMGLEELGGPLEEILAKLRENTGEAGNFGRAIQDAAQRFKDFQLSRAEGGFPDPLDEEGAAGGGPAGGAEDPETAADKREREKIERERERLAEKADMLYLSLLTEEEAEFESYRRRLEQLEEYRDAELLLEEEFDVQAERLKQQHERNVTRIREQAQRERMQKVGQLLTAEQQSTLSTLESMTGAVAQHNRAMFVLNKAAAIANTIVSTHAGAAKALEWGWPLGPIFAGIIYAAGAMRVASIASTSFGSGTAPSASATPAPAVTPVGGAADAAAASTGRPAASQVSISLVGETFGRDQVRGLIERINEAVADGAVLRVA